MRGIPDYPLWLGHAEEARDVAGLTEAGILALVDLAIEEPPAAASRELVYCRFPLQDGPGNPEWLLRAAIEATAALVRSRTPTLVACGIGISRAPCIAAAAIARVREESPLAVLSEIARLGLSDVSPGLWADVVAAAAVR